MSYVRSGLSADVRYYSNAQYGPSHPFLYLGVSEQLGDPELHRPQLATAQHGAQHTMGLGGAGTQLRDGKTYVELPIKGVKNPLPASLGSRVKNRKKTIIIIARRAMN